MNVREFNYGQGPGQSLLGAMFAGGFAVVLVVILRDLASEPEQEWGAGMWVIAGAAVLSIAGAVVFVIQARNPEWSGRERLALKDTGIDFQPKMLFMRDVFVAYGDVRKLEIVNEEGTVELKIKHAGGTIRLHRWWFHDRTEFEVFAGIVAARSGQEVKRDWLS